ncbi:DUF1836 domain-containing protein [Lentilactobacillus kisonensis]|uniref:DUF1836 domain-containing protein n=2 Tax=Lentilactobacillus kisonensis TaxID=481722 RepID=H1LE60_9LACO|nr:DUF1836 domain-containing protein [Lentilactobacillus kisonensis]EHO52618.1 hypothetical protein HMPREF9104_00886 [Lentilactobacillus kisonensis F0435]KRL22583.1 hypothetical protein FC98_GL002179 [Lentilactobacillus kisonensis DSM 19906 = JCM 15041]
MLKQTISQRLAKLSLPSYDQLPTIALYMDQVIDQTNQYLTPLTNTSITKSMINSYVKKGLVARPIKKRYSKDHLATILVISVLKQILPLDTVADAIKIALASNPVPKAYNQFVTLFNSELKTIDDNHPTAEQYQLIAIKSLLYKLIVEDLIRNSIKK